MLRQLQAKLSGRREARSPRTDVLVAGAYTG